MSKKERMILEKLTASISKMSDKKKEYLLGLADGMALANASNPANKDKK